MKVARGLVLALGLVGLLSACGLAEVVAVVNFDLRVESPDVTARRGREEPVSVSVVRLSPVAPEVALSLQDPPAGVSAEDVIVPGAQSNGILKVKVTADAATGTHQLTVKGTGALVTKTAQFNLKVTD